MTEETKLTIYGFYLDQDENAILNDLAKADDRSRSYVIRWLIRREKERREAAKVEAKP